MIPMVVSVGLMEIKTPRMSQDEEQKPALGNLKVEIYYWDADIDVSTCGRVPEVSKVSARSVMETTNGLNGKRAVN